MHKRILAILLVGFLFFIFPYPRLVTSAISAAQNRNLQTIHYKSDVEPKDRKAEIVSSAIQYFAEEQNFKSYYYLAVDASDVGALTLEEELSILHGVRNIHERPIYYSYTNLKRIGLVVLLNVRQGVCLKVDQVEYLDNKRAKLTVSALSGGLGSHGEELFMEFTDGHWEVMSVGSVYWS